MSTPLMIALGAVAVAVIAIFIAARSDKPRVTIIETRKDESQGE